AGRRARRSGRNACPGAPPETGLGLPRGPPPPLPPDVPQPLAQVVRRCLEKDPARRFHSASDLAFVLESLRSASERRQEESVRRGRWLGLALLGGLGVAVLLLLLRPAPGIRAPRGQPLPCLPGPTVAA